MNGMLPPTASLPPSGADSSAGHRNLLLRLPSLVRNLSTADIVAFERAWHQRADPPVLEDPYARLLCGPLLGLATRFRPLGWYVAKVELGPIMPASMVVVIRARYAEQALEHAVERGVSQYVMVGAGMDSFPFRRPDLAERVEIYEIDHPAVQRRKLERIRKAGLDVSPTHHFIGADLTEVTVVDALGSSSFDTARPAFLSLLGVVYYLTPDALEATARSIAAGLSPGSCIVVDYLLDQASSAPGSGSVRSNLLKLVEDCGEPMRSEYSLDQMDALMRRSGFEPVDACAAADLEDAYRRELGSLPFEVPGIFGIGTFAVAGPRDRGEAG